MCAREPPGSFTEENTHAVGAARTAAVLSGTFCEI